jgi:hypothetical protein
MATLQEIATPQALTSDQQSTLTALAQQLGTQQSLTAQAGLSGGLRALTTQDQPGPSAAPYTKLATLLNPLVLPANQRKPAPLPTQLGPMIWNPITFNGFETHGQAQLTLYSSGVYEFTGSFTDPSAWDYDDSISWGVLSSKGTLFTFSHSGSMHGWADRWLEGGSETDSWSNTGTNAAIKAAWPDLCAGYRWQAEASINSDLAGLKTLVEDILKAVAEVAAVIAVVA